MAYLSDWLGATRLAALLFLGCVILTPPAASAQTEGSEQLLVQQQDPVAATAAYLSTVPAEKRARSDAYFEGGYWLDLWSLLFSALIYLLLLHTGASARMRDWSARVTRRKPLQTLLYWLQFLIVTSIVFFPLTLYRRFYREHQYDLATQSLGAWMGDQLKEMLVAAILGGILMMILYGVLRRAPRTWWLWGAVVVVVFLMIVVMIAPLYIAPLFNKYTRLDDPRIKAPILAMAHANGLAAHDVWVMDASRQTTRISANVSGMLGTERITLNDNLLRRGTPAEIKAVMGHEIGHYVLHHGYKIVTLSGIVFVCVFAFLKWASDWVLRRWGPRWRVAAVQDVASLPLLLLLLGVTFYALTPVNNSIIRVHEAEADLFGLNAAREPDGFATVALKLAEYRKLAPGPLEEVIFFDHPSGRSRILMAMQWKQAQAALSAQAGQPSQFETLTARRKNSD